MELAQSLSTAGSIFALEDASLAVLLKSALLTAVMVGFDVDDMFPPELMRVTAASDIQRLQAEGEREWSKSATHWVGGSRRLRASPSVLGVPVGSARCVP